MTQGLERFVEAQDPVFDRVLEELADGAKQSHWMWFVFPQLRGLGRSDMARRYGLGGPTEVRAYDAHAVLGPRLRHCAYLMLEHAGTPAERILGEVDALKLRSCATLFAEIVPDPAPFRDLLATFHDGRGCPRTQAMLSGSSSGL